MMPALIISVDMINHDASFYTDRNCSDNFASPFAAAVIAGRGSVSDVLLHSAQPGLRCRVDVGCRHWRLDVGLRQNVLYLTLCMILIRRLECVWMVYLPVLGSIPNGFF